MIQNPSQNKTHKNPKLIKGSCRSKDNHEHWSANIQNCCAKFSFKDIFKTATRDQTIL